MAVRMMIRSSPRATSSAFIMMRANFLYLISPYPKKVYLRLGQTENPNIKRDIKRRKPDFSGDKASEIRKNST